MGSEDKGWSSLPATRIAVAFFFLLAASHHNPQQLNREKLEC
jgi:hypothetical protein